MLILLHWPALQVLFPIIFGICMAIFFSKKTAWIFGLIFSFLLFSLSIYVLIKFQDLDYIYHFGDWNRKIGIEYLVNYISQKIIFLSNFILIFFISQKFFLENNIFINLQSRRIGLFFSILFFAHAGAIGIFSSNDFFNLYVFIEIFSLASYGLIALGRDKKSLIASYEYLVIGSIAACFMLIGIGFIFVSVGSLNVSEVFSILIQDFINSKILYAGLVFLILGLLLKISFFPLHFAAMRIYSLSEPFLLLYISSFATMIGIFWIIKISQLVFITFNINELSLIFIKIFILGVIVITNIAAFLSRRFLRVVIFSSSANAAYIIFTILQQNYNLASYYLIIDVLNKICLFSLILIFPQLLKLNLDKINISYNNRIFTFLVFLLFIFIAGLPISNMFFIKLQILEGLFTERSVIEFIIISITFLIGFAYYFKIFHPILIPARNLPAVKLNISCYWGLWSILFMQILIFIFSNYFYKIKF